jgi:hypothetical protein
MPSLAPFSTPGRFWRGNLHTHSNLSDGALPLEDVVNRYKAVGYDFITMSEHFTHHFNTPLPTPAISEATTLPQSWARNSTLPSPQPANGGTSWPLACPSISHLSYLAKPARKSPCAPPTRGPSSASPTPPGRSSPLKMDVHSHSPTPSKSTITAVQLSATVAMVSISSTNSSTKITVISQPSPPTTPTSRPPTTLAAGST